MGGFHCPVRLVWDEGTIARLPELLRGLGVRRPLLVSDGTILAGPAGQAVLDGLAPVRVFDGCGIDARLAQIDRAVELQKAGGCDAVVGLGGGSALCTAKGTAIRATSGIPLRQLEGRGDLPADPLTMVLIPTTAGSGTEVSPFTILRDDADGAKFTVGGPRGFPTAALLDPLSLEGLPQPVAAAAAMDALTHAVEAATSTQATPLSDALAFRAAGLLFGALEGAVAQGENRARLDNLLGSAMANMACGQARLGLAHRLGRPLESATGASHGEAIGALLAATLPFALAGRPASAAELAAAFGTGDSPEALVAAIEGLADRIGFAPRLSSDKSARALAEAAVHRKGETPPTGPITGDTPIRAANGTVVGVAQAEALLDGLLAPR